MVLCVLAPLTHPRYRNSVFRAAEAQATGFRAKEIWSSLSNHGVGATAAMMGRVAMAISVIGCLLLAAMVLSNQGPRETGSTVSTSAPSVPASPSTSPTTPIELRYVTASSLNLRSGASTSAAVIGSLSRGTRIPVYSRSGDWLEVGDGSRRGWVSAQFTSATPPAAVPQKLVQPPAPPPPATTDPQPIREPRYGQGCDCPYDRKSNGARCGGTSAWSRPGGDSPICYTTD